MHTDERIQFSCRAAAGRPGAMSVLGRGLHEYQQVRPDLLAVTLLNWTGTTISNLALTVRSADSTMGSERSGVAVVAGDEGAACAVGVSTPSALAGAAGASGSACWRCPAVRFDPIHRAAIT